MEMGKIFHTFLFIFSLNKNKKKNVWLCLLYLKKKLCFFNKIIVGVVEVVVQQIEEDVGHGLAVPIEKKKE